MAKRRRLETPGAAELADLEAGFAPDFPATWRACRPDRANRRGYCPRHRTAESGKKIANARDSHDAAAWRQARDEGRVVSDLHHLTPLFWITSCATAWSSKPTRWKS